jgi:hypothetical protein
MYTSIQAIQLNGRIKETETHSGNISVGILLLHHISTDHPKESLTPAAPFKRNHHSSIVFLWYFIWFCNILTQMLLLNDKPQFNYSFLAKLKVKG